MNIAGSTALVTGANRGLGRHLARELLSRGAAVHAGARNPEAVDLPGAKVVALDIESRDPLSERSSAELKMTSNTSQNRIMSETHSAAPSEPYASRDSSEVRKGHPRWGGVSRWSAGLGTILAIIGTVIAFEQAHLADVTSQAADQQSLVSLIVDIATLSKSLPQTPGDELAPIHEEMAVDAEQGLALENELGGRVPAVDNLELGVGFEPSGDLRLALLSFTRAGTDATDPIYRSKALRAATAILYTLGGHANANAARNDSLLAYHAFDGQPDVPRLQFNQNHELVDLWDALWSAGSECPRAAPRAASELREATKLIKQDPESEDAAVRGYLRDASDDLGSCRAGRPYLPWPPSVPVS